MPGLRAPDDFPDHPVLRTLRNVQNYEDHFRDEEHVRTAIAAYYGMVSFLDDNIGQLLKVKIPAKRAPEVVERFLAIYEEQRQNGEEFNDTVDRIGPKVFEDAIRDLTVAPAFSVDTVEEFMDWERDVIYVLERGEGECAV